ncbi:MAG: VWA domain-containing protein [Arcobacter sp.]|uniref:VWA domain-containing protein n=1 Tax=Arcobacter sp. TaxID=1872629 RepID=UPI0025885303|nr:VWA domain-containing protein [Arcobacter sp.]MDY3205880.1 VWA domain-containing protein [Arcobacter sp.]
MNFVYYKVLFLMLIPSFILMYFILTKQNKLENYFSKTALNKLSISNQYFSNKTRNIILFLSLIFMIIALARPVTNEKINNSETSLTPIIIAIDVSKSMKAVDLFPNRLEFAKQKLLNILDNSKTEAIGVILFAKSSFLLSPVTEDFNSLKILIKNLDTGINFDNGTNIYSTLETTNKLLKNYSNKNLLLLTDGGDKENFDEEINFANKNDIKIYTLALATSNGSAIKEENGNYLTTKDGKIVNVKLNSKIKDLSLKTDGGYIEYSLDNKDIQQILDDINSKSNKENFENKKYKIYTELFYYPLAIAIFLLLIAFSSMPSLKRTKLPIFILFFSFNFTNSQLIASSLFDFKTIKEANKAYENQDYTKASKEFEKLDSNEFRDYNLANSLYKENKFKEAIDIYKNIKTSSNDLEFKKLHNLGNAYAKNSDFQNAVDSYEKALKLKNDSTTKENLQLVKKLLENKKDDNKNQNKQDEQKNNKENQKEEENKEDSSQKDENKTKNQNQKNQKNSKNEQLEQKEEISNFEEEKWLKELENQKTNSMLKKMESSKDDSISNPW